MSERKDGGPAFPNPSNQYANGMSLRDYFAAKALPCVTAGEHVDAQGDPERHAALAYKYADAMLAERAKDGRT